MNPHPNSKTRVLLVDDERSIVKVLSIKLRINGYEVMSTTSGAEAINLARTENPDIILLDILMPEISGFEVMDRVRQFSNVPIIMVSARTEMAEVARARGADGFISKPFDPDHVVKKVSSALNK